MLVGGWALPLWKMMEFVGWDDDIPNWMGKSSKCSKPPTSKTMENVINHMDFELVSTQERLQKAAIGSPQKKSISMI